MSVILSYKKKKRNIPTGKNMEGFNENELDLVKSQKNYNITMNAATATGHLEENFDQMESLETYAAMPAVQPTREMQAEFDRLVAAESYDRITEDAERHRIGQRIAHNMHRSFGHRGGAHAAHRLGQKHLGSGMEGIKGTLTMTVTRVGLQNAAGAPSTGYNIPFDLISELWNPLDILTGGNNIAAVQAQYAPGAVLLNINFTAAGDLVLTYGQASNNTIQDQVIVHCKEVSYETHLYGFVMGDILQVGGGPNHKPGGQALLSDPNAAQWQWPSLWYFTKRNFLGTYKSKPLNGGMFIDANQFLQQYQSILIGFPLSKDNGIMFTAAYNASYAAPSGLSLTVTFEWNFSVVLINDHHAPHHGHHAGHKRHGRFHYESLEQGKLENALQDFDSDAI